MALASTLRLRRRSVAGRESYRGESTDSDRLIVLTSLMIVLGTVRLVCEAVNYSTTLFEAPWRDFGWWGALGEFMKEHHPVIAVCAAWPLVLAFALRRTRWPELLPAAAATFLILALGGVMELIAEGSNAEGDGITIGSFHISRRAFFHTTISDVAVGVLGMAQLVLELATALSCVVLFSALRRAPAVDAGRAAKARKARYGRLGMYVSLGFIVVIIRMPVWATYIEVLNNSQLVRRYVLENDHSRPRRQRRGGPLTAEEQWVRSAQQLTTSAFHSAQNGQYLAAIDEYSQAIKFVEAAPSKVYPLLRQVKLAEALNNLAWLLATCPEVALRDPKTAVAYARRAVELQPSNGNYRNTLGVAYYRSSDWQLADEALHKSLNLRNADSFDWFFLALVELKVGRNTDQARGWYDKAVAWYHNYRPDDPELYRFQLEAASALGLPSPARPESMEAAARSPASIFPAMTRGRDHRGVAAPAIAPK
jgi:tetratricopeptide (TPR) repeat protein